MDYSKPLNFNLKKGALHKSLGVPQSKGIPDDKLEAALGSESPLTRKRAQFAENAKKFNHK